MTRRKTKKVFQTKKASSVPGPASRALNIRGGGLKSRENDKYSELRFKISLVILIAILSVSAYLFAIVLIWQGVPGGMVTVPAVSTSGNPARLMAAKAATTSRMVDDSSLDFKLKIPQEINSWIYKVGYVKDLTDDSESNQYLKIYFPLPGKSSAANFRDQYEDALTIIKFSPPLWEALNKGCQKGNNLYCGRVGTKLAENEEAVYTYTKIEDCPKEIQSSCMGLGKIIGSFQLR